MSADYDVITVGGGLGGSALAKVLAEHGARVLVVERERQFSDRIHGEWIAPWGVAEAQRIGIYDTLLERCAHETPNVEFVDIGPVRDLKATTPQHLPALTFYHPAMQEALIEAAVTQVRKSGAAPLSEIFGLACLPQPWSSVMVMLRKSKRASSYARTGAVRWAVDGADSQLTGPNKSCSVPACSLKILLLPRTPARRCSTRSCAGLRPCFH